MLPVKAITPKLFRSTFCLLWEKSSSLIQSLLWSSSPFAGRKCCGGVCNNANNCFQINFFQMWQRFILLDRRFHELQQAFDSFHTNNMKKRYGCSNEVMTSLGTNGTPISSFYYINIFSIYSVSTTYNDSSPQNWKLWKKKYAKTYYPSSVLPLSILERFFEGYHPLP